MMNRENQEREEGGRVQSYLTDGRQPSQPVTVCGGAACSSQEKARSEDLYITVSDPREEPALVPDGKTYYSYLITTRWNLSEPAGSKSRIRRRFRDFKTLNDRILGSFLGIGKGTYFIVVYMKLHEPYFPFKTEKQRLGLLARYLRILASNPVIRKSDEFIHFLLLNTTDVDGDENEEFLETLMVLEQYLRNFYQEAETLAKSLQDLGETMGIKLSKFETKAILDSQRIPAADMGKIFVTTKSKARKIKVLEDAIKISRHTNKSAKLVYEQFKEIHMSQLQRRFQRDKYNNFASMLREFIIKQTHYAKALAAMLETLAK